jgi:hypothetical protein
MLCDSSKRSTSVLSEEHLIATDISNYCGEPKRFNLYLGMILRIGKKKAYQIFSEMKQRNLEHLHKPPERSPAAYQESRQMVHMENQK